MKVTVSRNFDHLDFKLINFAIFLYPQQRVLEELKI